MGRICYSLKEVSRNYCLYLAATRKGAFIEIRLLPACHETDRYVSHLPSFAG